MVHLYTGMGKGKTTAALGLAFRALGQNRRVLLIQFMKKGSSFGECKAAKRFPKFKILQTGDGSWVRKDGSSAKDRQLAQKGLSSARKAIASNRYDLIILDELNVCVDYGLIEAGQVKQILKDKPRELEIVITGRHAHPQIIKGADLVSEIKEIKHYYKKGLTARKGIEY
jgi:cob(I)alamin adenosyltransferase